ncbi:MAG TPA: response regulator [Nitriliruptorales bacterium]
MALDRDRLLAIFGEELEDRRRDLERGLLALEDEPGAEQRRAAVAELFRAAHSLKGAAHSAGVSTIAEVAHGLEDLFAQLRDTGAAPDATHLNTALEAVDRLAGLAEGLAVHDRPQPGPQPPEGPSVRPSGAPGPPARSPTGGREQLRARVSSTDLDAAMAAAGELHLGVSRVGALAESAALTASQVRRLERGWQELRGSLSADPDGSHAAVLADRFGGLLEQARTSAGAVERHAAERGRHLTRAADEVRRTVQQLGLVPFEEVCSGLDRVVRDVAAATGKQARLDVDRGSPELDRTVAVVVRDPLGHLVRNAVDHGLEPPEVRSRAGKPPEGRITVRTALDAGELLVTVHDDGAGVDSAQVRRLASQRGLDVPDAEHDVVQLLFEPGFSTRTDTTDLSGRGVGLDVVRTAVEAVGGSADIRSALGEGTTVRMRLPLTLSTMRAVVLQTAGEVIALPAGAVEGVRRIQADAVTDVGGRSMVVVDDRTVTVADLGRVLGFGHATIDGDDLLVVSLRTVAGDAAAIVDGVVGEQEVWIRPLPGRLRGLRGLLGGAVLGDGRCVLLLSPATWVRAMRQQDGSAATRAPTAATNRARILLAEDAATTRMLEQSILEAAGYEVLAAPDGQEAWRLLQQQGADLVVTDVDMPNVDGFELCRRIRASPRFGELPVVLVTSLADERHRARGLEVGADAYFVKSSFDQTSLVDTIARLL